MANKPHKTLEAKIARIVSDDEVAVNVGETDGVTVGCTALIPREIEIRDPDTKEILGTVWRPLLRLEVVQVLEKLSVAQTVDPVEHPQAGTLGWRATLFAQETKQVTSDPALSDDRRVLVKPGDRILITIPEGDKGTSSG